MAFWNVSDGTVIRSGAAVEGSSVFADYLRRELFGLTYGEGPLVWLERELDGAVDLDPASDWLLDLWVRNEVLLAGLRVEGSDYRPSPEDIPPQAARELERSGGR